MILFIKEELENQFVIVNGEECLHVVHSNVEVLNVEMMVRKAVVFYY